MGRKKDDSREAQRVIEYCPVIDLPAEDYELLAEFTVNGEPGRKSNQRRIVTNRRTGKPMLIKSAKSMDYSKEFKKQLPKELENLKLGSLTDPLVLWVHIYYASNRPDVSSETIMDMLQDTGVITNDRYLKAHFLFGSVDRDNPHALIRIYKPRITA